MLLLKISSSHYLPMREFIKKLVQLTGIKRLQQCFSTLIKITFTIDTANWMVDQQAADAYTGTSCSANAAICGTAVAQACKADCTGSCDAASHTCDLALQIALYSTIDLQMEQSELASIDARKGISVTIDGASYQVTDNELSVDAPEMTIYVAPVTVMTPSDALAKPIGTVPTIPAMTIVDETMIQYTDTGKADLQGAMTAFTTPFNMLVGSTIMLGAGSQVPTGKLTATVKVTAHAHAL